jgi:signal transduction histidine kinase
MAQRSDGVVDGPRVGGAAAMLGPLRDRLSALLASFDPPKRFAAIASVLIFATLVATSLTQSTFIGQSAIDRESQLVGEMVRTLAARELSIDDLQDYRAAATVARFERSFGIVRQLSGVVRIKVFSRDETIVWSDEPQLVGSHFTMHHEHLAQALAGETHAVFDPPERALINAHEDLPQAQLIEFYVPLYLGGPHGVQDVPSGAFALYRTPDEVNRTIRHSLWLLWLVTGIGGVVLYLSLINLVNSIYGRQRKAEREFAALSEDHLRILHVEKLSAVGQTVSEIAHQINNPLVGVVNLAQLASREADNPARVKEIVAQIRSSGEHCRGFVQRMLGFSQIARCQPEMTDMKALVRDVVQLFGQSGDERSMIVVDEPAADLVLNVDQVLLRHALFNLLQNAVQACPAGPVEIGLAVAGAAQDDCVLSVRDHGPGIDRKVAEKVFSPFFSTRPGGTGLGLPVVKLVAIWHGGAVRVENDPGGGARFTMTLPMQRK